MTAPTLSRFERASPLANELTECTGARDGALHDIEPEPARVSPGPTRISPMLGALVEEAAGRWATSFGAASVAELRERFAERLRHLEAMTSAEPAAMTEAAEQARVGVEWEHRERHRPTALSAELTDERERDAAIGSGDALVAYEAKWRRRLRRMQHAHPGRWRVAGLSEEEVRDLLTLRLIEVVTTERSLLSKHQRAGKEWGMLCMQEHLQALRKSFGLSAMPVDFDEAPLFMHAPSQEDQWLDREAAQGMALARERAELGLSRPQRRWLAALKLSANAGAFFESSHEPNLSAASRLLGKNRSSAQRAYRELQGRFIKELNHLK